MKSLACRERITKKAKTSLSPHKVRIDFVDTELLTPKNGNCEDQYMVVGGDIWPTGLTRLCGVNSDQHFYVHIDKTEEEQNVDFTITTAISRYRVADQTFLN